MEAVVNNLIGLNNNEQILESVCCDEFENIPDSWNHSPIVYKATSATINYREYTMY